MELEELARKYALKNAVDYGGECNPGAVIGQIMSEEDFDPEEVQKVAGKVCGEVNSMSLEKQKEELQEYAFEEKEDEHDPIPDLEDAEEEEVVVRFAPNPNSPPHIGHARGMVINGELRDKYDGKLILRFDDTDPVTKRPLKTEEYDAYEMYQEDYEWLGYKPDEVRISSKNFDEYIEHAEKLIEKGKAYVCKCSQEEGQKYRKEGQECPCRNKSPEKEMEEWEKMQSEYEEGEAILKIKTDMNHKNPAVRDFVAYRIIEDADHPIVGNDYRVYPLLDFAGAIEDQLMGTTHIVRGKDLRASTKRQKYIYDYFDWDYPNIQYWGHVKISGFNAPVSGSSISDLIEEGELKGWGDIRAPTVRALRRRGFEPEAIQEFFIEMGVSEKDLEASVETLESHNRDIVEEKADRFYFVKNPVKMKVENLQEEVNLHLPRHPDYPDRGERSFDINQEDGKVELYIEEEDLEKGFLRLKGLFNIEITDLKGREAEYREGDHKVAIEKDASIIHWSPSNSETAELKMPDGSNFEGYLEPGNNIQVGEVVQFERIGFVRKDSEEKFLFCHN